MGAAETFLSTDELLRHPLIKSADFLELTICDVVHFRLLQPEHIFQLTEKRLRRRNPERYSGFADCRKAVELSMRGSSSKDKVDACCTRRPEWVDDRQILYATELEVWMDMSYPNPWALDLYHKALMEGKYINIPPLGSFSETFHELLKDKNGYELTETPDASHKTVRLHIGEQPYLPESYNHLIITRRESRPHPLGDDSSLPAQIAFGIMEKDLEKQSAQPTPLDTYIAHTLGYRLLGPTMVVFLHALAKTGGPISITGLGATFLSKLIEDIRPFWSWLPVIQTGEACPQSFSLIAEGCGGIPLLPSLNGNEGSPILPFERNDSTELVVSAVNLFTKAALEGPVSADIQRSIKAFVHEYAQMTRGMVLPIPTDPVIKHWNQWTLAPAESILDWVRRTKPFPEFNISHSPKALKKLVTKGPWPTGSYLLAGKLSRWWTRQQLGSKVSDIESAYTKNAE